MKYHCFHCNSPEMISVILDLFRQEIAAEPDPDKKSIIQDDRASLFEDYAPEDEPDEPTGGAER